MIAKLSARYLLLFAAVLAAISAVAYLFVLRLYTSELQPALDTPEGRLALQVAMRHVALTIGAFDLPLLIVVGIAAYLLARTSIAPLAESRERERRFAADAAHELRSPLAIIATVAQAARGQSGEALAQSLQTITRTALDASSIVGDLLTLAREPSEVALHREPVDLSILARQCVREFEEQARESEITIELQNATALVNADERRVRELLRNMLENALRHATSSVIVKTAREGSVVELRVEDDGPGIAPELREQLFERYFRAESTADGSGLGLAIGRWIAQAHGGSLVATDATLRSGAAFSARFPAL